MKIIAICDLTIPEDELQEVVKKFNDLYAPLNPEWDIHREDMSDLQWSEYPSGGIGIDKSYLKRRAKAIKRRYGSQHVLFWVSHDNYLPAQNNIWGRNTSNFVMGVHIHQCRFDTNRTWRKSRIINTFGTLVHEVAHSHDAQIFNRLGKVLNRIVGVEDWDESVVHGEDERFAYIGRDEDINRKILEQIMPLLKQAYQENVRISLIKKALSIARQIITILKKKDHE